MDEEMDEIWQDFYATVQPKFFDLEPQPSAHWQRHQERKRLIHVAILYDQVASTGTQTPVNDLAARIECAVEAAADLVQQCIDAKLLCAPKRGSFRCELSVIAKRMIARMDYH